MYSSSVYPRHPLTLVHHCSHVSPPHPGTIFMLVLWPSDFNRGFLCDYTFGTVRWVHSWKQRLPCRGRADDPSKIAWDWLLTASSLQAQYSRLPLLWDHAGELCHALEIWQLFSLVSRSLREDPLFLFPLPSIFRALEGSGVDVVLQEGHSSLPVSAHEDVTLHTFLYTCIARCLRAVAHSYSYCSARVIIFLESFSSLSFRLYLFTSYLIF